MQKIYKKKIKGFTLVELIIVITILAILATIAFVSFQSYTSDSRDATRISNLTWLQKWLDAFALKVWQYPLPDDIYATGLFKTWAVNDTLNYVWYVKENISRLISMNKVPIDPVWNTNFVYWVSANQNKYQIAGTLEKKQANTGIITTTYAAMTQAKVVWNYTYPLKIGTKVYSLPSLIFVWTGNLVSNSTWFVINNGQNLAYSIDGKPLNNTQTTAQVLQIITGTPALILTWIDVSAYTWAQNFKSLSSLPADLQSLWITKDQVWISLFWDPYLAATAPKPWNCWDMVTTLDGSHTYTTITWPDGKCWTSQNMRHGSMLANGTTAPSNNAWIEKWCYNNLASNCNSDGGLYTWQESMGINAWDTTSNTEVSSLSVCWQLGTNWALPTHAQWTSLTTAWATWWAWNKLSWIVSTLPWFRDPSWPMISQTSSAYRWSSTVLNTTDWYGRNLGSTAISVASWNYGKNNWFSVVCIKN